MAAPSFSICGGVCLYLQQSSPPRVTRGLGGVFREKYFSAPYSAFVWPTLPRNACFVLKDGFPAGYRPGVSRTVTRAETKKAGAAPPILTAWASIIGTGSRRSLLPIFENIIQGLTHSLLKLFFDLCLHRFLRCGLLLLSLFFTRPHACIVSINPMTIVQS